MRPRYLDLVFLGHSKESHDAVGVLHHLLKKGDDAMLALARDISLCSLFLAYFDQGKKK